MKIVVPHKVSNEGSDIFVAGRGLLSSLRLLEAAALCCRIYFDVLQSMGITEVAKCCYFELLMLCCFVCAHTLICDSPHIPPIVYVHRCRKTFFISQSPFAREDKHTLLSQRLCREELRVATDNITEQSRMTETHIFGDKPTTGKAYVYSISQRHEQ